MYKCWTFYPWSYHRSLRRSTGASQWAPWVEQHLSWRVSFSARHIQRRLRNLRYKNLRWAHFGIYSVEPQSWPKIKTGSAEPQVLPIILKPISTNTCAWPKFFRIYSKLSSYLAQHLSLTIVTKAPPNVSADIVINGRLETDIGSSVLIIRSKYVRLGRRCSVRLLPSASHERWFNISWLRIG